MNKEKIIVIPSKYIKGKEKLNSDQLFLLMILLQGKTENNNFMLSIRYLCQRLNTTTGNTNRTRFIIKTLKYFQDNKIIFFSNDIECENEINIEEFCNKNKMDIIFGEILDDKKEPLIINYENIKKIFIYCENNKINKYFLIHCYLYMLSVLQELTYSYIDIDLIKFNLNISENTLLKYINILQDIEIFNYELVGYNKIATNKYNNKRIYYYKSTNTLAIKEIINYINENSNLEIINKDKQNIDENSKYHKIYYDNLESLNLKGVYLIRNLDNKMLKIGVCTDLNKRFNEIKGSFKFCGLEPNLKIECFIEINNNCALESYLHKEFEYVNYQNEWFNIKNISIVSEKVKDFINKL